MATSYTILHAVRLTGKLITDPTTNESSLVIVTKAKETALDNNDLYIEADPERIPVRVECYDFTDPTTGITWQFMEFGPWRRGTGDFAWTQFTSWTDGENFGGLDIKAQSQEATAQEKPKKIYIKIKPVIDGPDET